MIVRHFRDYDFCDPKFSNCNFRTENTVNFFSVTDKFQGIMHFFLEGHFSDYFFLD